MQSEKLIQNLIEETRQIINRVEELRKLDLSQLTWKANPASWSILECIEHLNLYGKFYLPQIGEKIKRSTTQSVPEFKPGVLGNYFAKSMLPKEKLNKMKTFKVMNPLHAQLDKSVIDQFISQQLQFLELLNQSRKVNLNKIKITTSISSLLKLRLGDTFQFLVNHMWRHLAQIERVRETFK